METVDDAPRPSAAAKPVPAAVVVQSRGRPACRVLRLDGPLELGRDTPALAADERLSRRHLRVERRQGRFTVRDLGSRNGTWVDGHRIDDVVTVGDGAVVRGGRTVILLLEDARALEARGVEVDGASVAGPALAQAIDAVGRAALRGTTLLLRGESGTGKERAARAFHALGPAAPGPFVPVNCATLPEGVAERLLFGAKKGAYSGAVEGEGLVESAHKGVLFLDEVGELDPDVQAKLLRVLETREVLPLGANRPAKVDVRFVFATHRDLRADVAAGRFRGDLFYRIEQPSVILPPLRTRPEEVPYHVAAVAGPLPVHAAFVEACLGRPWPGNVRELRHHVAAAVEAARADAADELLAEHLDEEAGRAVGEARDVGGADPDLATLEAALDKSGGNVSAAARTLGVHRTQLRRWMERHGLRAR